MQDWRIRFRKTGTARYISHLDITRTMMRALRRAELPIWYTEGFHRHPYVSFAMPLALGQESDCECMDLRLTEPMTETQILTRLNAVLPTGLEAYAAAAPVYKAAEIAWAHYDVRLTCPLTLWQTFATRDTVTAAKKNKKGVWRQVDLKPYLETGEAFSTDNGGTRLVWSLPCTPTGSISPVLILEALRTFAAEQGADPFDVEIRRTQLSVADEQPFV